MLCLFAYSNTVMLHKGYPGPNTGDSNVTTDGRDGTLLCNKREIIALCMNTDTPYTRHPGHIWSEILYTLQIDAVCELSPTPTIV